MHELSIAISLIDLATEALEDAGEARSVRVISVRVGDLSGVVVEALEFAWEMASEGTRCDGARLEIERVVGRVRCPSCDTVTELEFPPTYLCESCGRPTAEVVGGKELDLMTLEIDDQTEFSNATEPTHEATNP